jgi:copper resistance protein D
MFDLIVGARIVHFASSIIVAGAAIFSLVVIGPTLTPYDRPLARKQRQFDGLILGALGFAIASGALWLLFIAAEIGQTSTGDALTEGIAWTFLTDTQFGRVSEIRLVLAFMLAGSVLVRRRLLPRSAALAARAIALLGTSFVASLAWCGHAGGGLGFEGGVHLTSDIVHLVTAAVWVGGLIPLLLLIDPHLEMPSGVQFNLIRRFSSLAVLAVVGLAATGVINTWFMLSSWQDLFTTEYGRLVLAKVALFLIMLAFASANRFWLTPLLLPATEATDAKKYALRLLCLFTTIELVLGTVVVCVVALLGQLPPASHIHAGD